MFIISLSLLYMDFADACRTSQGGQIEQCIRCFAIIFQTTRSTKYACEIIYIVAYFKRLRKKIMKEAWLRSCLINISSWPNKFVPDNWCGEIIIMLNKENINPFTNAKSDKFFCKIVLQNMLSLCNSKEVLLQAIGSIKHYNCYSTISSYLDVCYLVKFLTKEVVFHEQLGRGDSRSDLTNLFANGSASLAKKVLLSKYITSF